MEKNQNIVKTKTIRSAVIICIIMIAAILFLCSCEKDEIIEPEPISKPESNITGISFSNSNGLDASWIVFKERYATGPETEHLQILNNGFHYSEMQPGPRVIYQMETITKEGRKPAKGYRFDKDGRRIGVKKTHSIIVNKNEIVNIYLY